MALATSTIVAIAAVAVAAGTAYVAADNAADARDAQKKAQKVSQAEQAAQRQAQIRQQVRQERVKRAQILQASENTGVTSSSGALGAESVLGTQTAGNIGTINRAANSSTVIGDYMQSAADSQGKAANWQAVSSLAGSVAGVSASSPGTQSDFNRYFGYDPNSLKADTSPL